MYTACSRIVCRGCIQHRKSAVELMGLNSRVRPRLIRASPKVGVDVALVSVQHQFLNVVRNIAYRVSKFPPRVYSRFLLQTTTGRIVRLTPHVRICVYKDSQLLGNRNSTMTDQVGFCVRLWGYAWIAVVSSQKQAWLTRSKTSSVLRTATRRTRSQPAARAGSAHARRQNYFGLGTPHPVKIW